MGTINKRLKIFGSLGLGLILVWSFLSGSSAEEPICSSGLDPIIAKGVLTCDAGEAPAEEPLLEGVLAPPPGSIVIDFDDGPAPCFFHETIALRNQYSDLGILFRGPGPFPGKQGPPKRLIPFSFKLLSMK